jgi:hypothetical protein
MSSAPSQPEIARDARWLAQALDLQAGTVRLIEMTAEAYRAASFLDDRMLLAPVNAHVRPFAEVAAAMAGDARRDARWIFHIGHVGSTLVSRLLGELDGVLAIREPRLLRDLAAAPAAQREGVIPAVQKLLSRTFADCEAALVKATSFVGEIAAELVPPGERALFLHTDPRTYVATILAGENNLKELAALAGDRARRMTGRVNGLAGSHAAHLAAAAWACEMTALEAAAEAMPDRRLQWLDFDALLSDMAAGTRRIAEFFGFDAPAGRMDEIVRGPLMARYSKALEYDYSPSLRRALIDQAIAAHGREIDDALAMLDRSAQESPLLARAIARAGAER